MKIAIIGGSGFVGTRLISQLGKENCYNIDKKQSLSHPEITFVKNILECGLNNHINSDTSTVILLAAEHRDDVSPISLYYDVNVNGALKVLDAMDSFGIKNIIFTSSVAVYGLNKTNPDESHTPDPFNHYGKSKWEAEEILREWHLKNPDEKSLTIIRPTVIFGERNRGNVYNLLRQIVSGKFIMIGNGKNKKSMAYVGNIVSFINYCVLTQKPGYRLYNYVDKPDLTTNELVQQVEICVRRKNIPIKLPYVFGYIGGKFFDLLSIVLKRKYSISSIRVKKFCATTQFDSSLAHNSGFKAPFSLNEGLQRTIKFEFIDKHNENYYFESE